VRFPEVAIRRVVELCELHQAQLTDVCDEKTSTRSLSIASVVTQRPTTRVRTGE
jgi:hypothetical protein